MNALIPSACNIRFIQIPLLILGHYQDLQKSKRIQRIFKLFSVFMASILLYLFLTYAKGLPTLPKTGIAVEYCLHISFSLITNGKLVATFYSFDRLLDRLPNSQKVYKKLRITLILILVAIFILRCLSYVMVCMGVPMVCFVFEPLGLILTNVMYFANDLGRFSTILIFSLMYCRVRLIRTTLQAIGFKNTPRMRLTPSAYIQMYENVLDGLSSVELPTKFLVFTFMIYSSPRSITGLFEEISEMKENGPRMLNIFWYLTTLVLTNLTLIVPAIALDLMSLEVDAIKVIVIEERIACRSEREKEKIQELYMFIKNQPIEYNLWDAAPLSVHTLFTFMSFALTTLISVQQMKNIFQ